MTDYIKRIQSSLQRKVNIPRKQIKEYMEQQNMDVNNPNSEQIEAVKYYFLSEAEERENALAATDNDPRGIDNIAQEDSISGLLEDCLTLSDAAAQENALTVNPEIRGMVGLKAGAMGIPLAQSQIDGIASQIDASGNSFSQTLAEIENALIAYIDYQHSQEASQVSSMLERVTERVAVKNYTISQQLSDGCN
ncbi:MAG: hypothetical protein V7L29_03690 [Nostoc sp.]|uniref:hypothetical protein n=1 Tax=Nostoc sp. TaxID=1180 RepID=UPI002FF44718